MMKNVVGVVLRALLLFILDGITNSLPLCAVASYLGYQNLFEGVPYVVSLNESHENPSEKRYAMPATVTTFQALFSWNGPCNELWDYLTLPAHLFTLVFYLISVICVTGLLFSETERIVGFWLYLAGTVTAIGNYALCLAVPEVESGSRLGGTWLWTLGFALRLGWGWAAARLYLALRRRASTALMPVLTKALLRMAFFAPALMYLAPVLGFQLRVSRLAFSLLLPLFLQEILAFIFLTVPAIAISAYQSFLITRISVQEFGLHAVLLHHWARLQVPVLARCYWATRLSALLLFLVFEHRFSGWDSDHNFPRIRPSESDSGWEWVREWRAVGEYVLARSCESFIAVVGTTSAVSAVGHLSSRFTHWLLVGRSNHQLMDEPEEEISSGGHLGSLFLILALQTGLPDLSPEKRLLKLYRNLSLLSMAQLHLAHGQADTVLGRLAATGLFRRTAHIRALVFCAFLVCLSWMYVASAWANGLILDPWVISVVVFALEVVLKVLICAFLVYLSWMYVASAWANGLILDPWVISVVVFALEIVLKVLICAFLVCLSWMYVASAWANGLILDPWVISVVVFALEVVLKVLICAFLVCLSWMYVASAWANGLILDPWVISVVVFALEVVLKVLICAFLVCLSWMYVASARANGLILDPWVISVVVFALEVVLKVLICAFLVCLSWMYVASAWANGLILDPWVISVVVFALEVVLKVIICAFLVCLSWMYVASAWANGLILDPWVISVVVFALEVVLKVLICAFLVCLSWMYVASAWANGLILDPWVISVVVFALEVVLKVLICAFLVCLSWMYVASAWANGLILDPWVISVVVFALEVELKVLICAFLVCLSWMYVASAWANGLILDPWVISVVVFALEVVLKTLVSLVVYALIMCDTKYGPFSSLDDWIYAVKGLGAGLEFLCAIILLVDGVYILIFEQRSALRSVMIFIHAYFNIYMQAKEGWESFRRRWQAARRLDNLKTLSADTLRERLPDEVCSICYQELLGGEAGAAAVKETKCGHTFHLPCLRKWLVQQDACPFCHAPVLRPAPPEESNPQDLENDPPLEENVPESTNLEENDPGTSDPPQDPPF